MIYFRQHGLVLGDIFLFISACRSIIVLPKHGAGLSNMSERYPTGYNVPLAIKNKGRGASSALASGQSF